MGMVKFTETVTARVMATAPEKGAEVPETGEMPKG
jgi:hypothetical protein